MIDARIEEPTVLAFADELNMQLRKEIVRLHGDLGFTLVYVAHNCDEAEALNARIIHHASDARPS